MRYEAMGRNRVQRLNVPQLLGGLNAATEPSLIEDDELADVCNLTPDHGALVTREAVRAVGTEPLTVLNGQLRMVDRVFRHPITIDDQPCTVILSAVNPSDVVQSICVTVQVVTLSGECKATYTLETGATVYLFAVAPCDAQQHGAPFLLYHHGNVYIPDDDTGTMKQVGEDKLYAPLVMIGGQSIANPDGLPLSYKLANGVMFEGFNALTNRYRVHMTSSGATEAEYYVLPTSLEQTALDMEILTASGVVTVSMKVGGEAVGFSVGSKQHTAQALGDGYVRVSPALEASDISGNVTITCERTRDRGQGTLSKVSEATWFGGTQNERGGTRLFLASRADARLMWSDINNPFYIPENNYMVVGDVSQKITALEKQGDMLVIFKERELFYTTYVQGEIDADAVKNGTNVDVTVSRAYFPLTQLSPQIGCRCPDSIALCRDRLVWMDEDARIYTLVTTGLYSERNVREIGQKVRPFLLENTTARQRKTSSAVDHKGKYRLMIGNRMAEFDYYDSGFVNVSGYASGERASRHIAWFVHTFDGFEETEQQLVSDGAERALLISTGERYPTHKLIRVAYTFAPADTDCYADFADSGITVTEQPIVSTLTTKTYELSDPAAYKRIGAFFPMLRTSGAMLRFIPDGKLPVSGRWYQSDDLYAHLVLPSVKRCHTLAIRIDAEGALCIKGLRLQYTPFGTVR